MIISEFGAGLGDVITLIYNSERYNILEKLAPDERAMVILMSHNPHAKELFLWHPKAKQIEIRDVGFWWPSEDKKKRAEHHLPPAQPLHLIRQESVKFYPSPEDYAILETLKSFPYVVMNAAAGGIDRNIPEDICEDISQGITGSGQRDFGLRMVVVGRTYNAGKRKERKFIPRGGLIDMVDRLTVPGTIELIARSRGVVCCHSAICLIAWYLKKPVFLLYPNDVKEREFNRPAHQYTIGKDFPTTIHLEFDDYKRAILDRFINLVGKA
ncbi:MAG: hypothetical protein L0Y56_15165 [Nitrospira sp.]|nr:hypothetical protein [Nitrospira sp.]